MNTHTSVGAHMRAHMTLGGHTSARMDAHTSFGAYTIAHTRLGAHIQAPVCAFFCPGTQYKRSSLKNGIVYPFKRTFVNSRGTAYHILYYPICWKEYTLKS